MKEKLIKIAKLIGLYLLGMLFATILVKAGT